MSDRRRQKAHCPYCGQPVHLADDICVSCGRELLPPETVAAPEPSRPDVVGAPTLPRPQASSPWGVASLVLGIAVLLTCGVTGPFALWTGIVSVRRREPGSVATVGIVLGSLGCLVLVMSIIGRSLPARREPVEPQRGTPRGPEPAGPRHVPTAPSHGAQAASPGSGLTCSMCGGKGWVHCSVCNGAGRVHCALCNGAGSHQCWLCNGSGRSKWTGAACSLCGGSGRTACPLCDGTGWLTCAACNGYGKKWCPLCDGSGRVHLW